MATRAEKKKRRQQAGSASQQTQPAHARYRAGGALGRKTIGPVGRSLVKSIMQPDAGLAELRADATLVRRSIRERWPSTGEKRTAIRDKVEELALVTPDDQILVVLCGVLLRMDQQNLMGARTQLEAAGLIGPRRTAQIEPAVPVRQVFLNIPSNGRENPAS